MKKQLFFFIGIVLGFINCFANDDIEISLLTCAPGTEVHSHFGHTALRINDKARQKDVVYNFGLFDYNTPNFPLKFLRGRLEYKLGIQKTKNFIRQYDYEQRAVFEQKLNLNNASKQKVLQRLDFLYQPENRYYLYSFIKKNCSTEVRDLIFQNDVKYENILTNNTARYLINSYLNNDKWLRFGINLVLGKFVDQELDVNQTMFLPDYLYNVTAVAQYDGLDLVKEDLQLNNVPKRDRTNTIFSPLLIFSFIALVLLFRFLNPFKYVLFFFVGVAGIALVWMWLFSDHPEVKNNFNVLWCNPLYLFYLPFAFLNKQNKVFTICLLAFLVVSLVVWILKIQVFDIAALPIIGILIFLLIKDLLNHKSNSTESVPTNTKFKKG